MTISQFRAHELLADDPPAGRGCRRRYRAHQRAQGEACQEAFDAEVARAAYDHNISEPEARRVVNARKRFEHRRAIRGAR